MRVIYLLNLFAILNSNCINAQRKVTSIDKIKVFNIVVNADNSTIKTQMLNSQKKIFAYNERVYLWYKSQKIISTTGGYEGKLLHGYYKEFYLNDQLKEQGSIKYGLKTSKWKYWYEDGKLKEVIHWKKGVKSGPYLLYNDFGVLMAKGTFKKDKLDGVFITYSSIGKILEKRRFKKGVEVIKKKKNPQRKKVKTRSKRKATEGKTINKELIPSETNT